MATGLHNLSCRVFRCIIQYSYHVPKTQTRFTNSHRPHRQSSERYDGSYHSDYLVSFKCQTYKYYGNYGFRHLVVRFESLSSAEISMSLRCVCISEMWVARAKPFIISALRLRFLISSCGPLIRKIFGVYESG